MTFLKQTDYIVYALAKLSKYVKIACRLPKFPFCRGFFTNKQSLRTSFVAALFEKKICFVILHKLAKSHYQNVFTS